MLALETIQRAASERSLRFLVIGGFAVNFHGFTRATADVDLAVEQSRQEEWIDLLGTLGFQSRERKAGFIQLESNDPSLWPVDLMLANETTFNGLWEQSKTIHLGGAQVRAVSLDHLLAMKLHVLKQARVHRFLKDYQDVISLVTVNELDIRSEKYRKLFEKYGTPELYERVVRECSGQN